MAIFTKVQKSIFNKNMKENGSKFFQMKIPSIPAGSSYLLQFSTPDAQFWLPFDYCSISNNDAPDFELWLNQNKDDVLLSSAGTIKIIEDKAIYSIVINNNSAVASIADKLILNFRKKGVDAQNIIQKVSSIIGV